MNKYQVVGILKVRTPAGIRELGPGKIVTLPEHMAEPLLAQGRIKPVAPYFDPDGDLVIPFGSDSRYHWWRGGQSTKETIEEVNTWKH